MPLQTPLHTPLGRDLDGVTRSGLRAQQQRLSAGKTRACPTAGYALCAHVEELKGLTHDDLKWGRDSPLKKVGTFDELEPEARRIVRATLLAHPFEILQRAMVDAGRQLLRFQAGDGLSQDFARMVAGALAPMSRKPVSST